MIFCLSTGWAQTQFEDISSTIDYRAVTTQSPWGSGVSAEDFDNDGDIDLFLSASRASPNILLINQGGGNFKEVPFEKEWNTAASLWIDYNGDHLPDLFLAGSCPYGVAGCSTGSYWRLLKQETGGTFSDVTDEAGLGSYEGLMYDYLGGLAAGDLNLDGYLDLVVTYWTGPAIVFMNNGDGSFQNASERINDENYGVFWQPLVYDLDDDGWSEIYLTLEFGNPNQLWKQTGDLYFQNIAASVGLDSQCDDMGIAFGDVENDGDLDIYISCREFEDKYNPLLLNENTIYTENARGAGVGNGGWAWGTTFLDANNDGFQDLAVTNGVLPADENDSSKFWLNNGNGTFSDVSRAFNFDDLLKASSLISLDFDRDGDLDMIQSVKPYDHGGKSFRFLKNRLENFNKGNYLVVKPRMLGTNHQAIGSKVKIRYGDKIQVRPITAGISYFGQEPAEAFFGLGKIEMVDEVEIIWPGGGKTIQKNVAANQVITLSDAEALHPPYLKKISYAYEGSVTLSWKKMSRVETAFIIKVAKDSLFSDPFTIEVSSDQSSQLVTDLIPGQKYYFRLIAMNSGGQSIPGNILSETAPSSILEAPTDVVGTLLPEYNVQLTWKDNSINETGYEVERSLSETFENTVTFELGPNADFHKSKNLQPGFTYYFRVRAKGTNWKSEYSEAAAVKTVYVLNLPDQDRQLSIYPNPSEDILYISGTDRPAQVQILSLDGKILRDFKSEIYFHDLRPGIYLVRITTTSKETHLLKLVVQ